MLEASEYLDYENICWCEARFLSCLLVGQHVGLSSGVTRSGVGLSRPESQMNDLNLPARIYLVNFLPLQESLRFGVALYKQRKSPTHHSQS